jgi:uncharacterized membrane protein
MKLQFIPFIIVILIFSGCTLSTTDNIRLKGNLNPSQITIDKRLPISIEATVENIANSTETISVDVEETEGLSIRKPERTSFTLKPGESRTVIFMGTLDEAAVPGKYRIEITSKSKSGSTVHETIFLNVVVDRGLI